MPGVRAGDRAIGERRRPGPLRPTQRAAELGAEMVVGALPNRAEGDVESRRPVMGLTGQWRRFAAALATMPDLVERLSTRHTPTPTVGGARPAPLRGKARRTRRGRA
jgi:hypothetical protein